MTIAARNPMSITNTAAAVSAQPAVMPATTARSYARIVVLLDGSGASERAIAKALVLPQHANAEIVLICASKSQVGNYIDAKVASIRDQGFNVRGYTVNTTLNALPMHILKSEKADAIVVAQESPNWLGRLLGNDVATYVNTFTSADVFEVNA